MWQRRAVAFIGAAFGLGLIGTLAGPRWRPKPLERALSPESEDTSVGPTHTEPSLGVIRELRRLPLGAGDAIVEVARPDAPGQWPAVVFAHGAGTGNHTAFTEHIEALAARGIACLVPDKQLATYTQFHRDYEAMGREYYDLAEWAREQEWADPLRVGYWGESEGSWIVPVAVGLDPRAAFLLLVSAPGVTPRGQSLFSACAYLRNTEVPEGLLHAVPRLLGGPMPAGRFDYADWDAEPLLSFVDCPVFVAYGTQDTSVPQIQGAWNLREALGEGGNDAVAVRYYDANHGMRVGEDTRLCQRFISDAADWVCGLPATGRPAVQVAGVEPRQPFWVIPAPKVRWFGRLAVQGWFGGICLGLAGGVPLIRAMARGFGVKPSRLPVALRMPFGVFVGGALASVLGFAAYVARVARLATTYRRDPITVQGGYRAVRGVAAASVAGGVLFWSRLMDHRGPPRGASRRGGHTSPPLTRAQVVRITAGSVGAVGLLIFGSYWGILPLEPRSADIPR